MSNLSFKQLIKDQFTTLEALGQLVFNFNYNKKMPTGIVSMVDYIVSTSWGTYWCEVKIDKDKYSEKQWETRLKLKHNNEEHLTVTEKNYLQLVQYIMGKHVGGSTFQPELKHYKHLNIDTNKTNF